VFVYLFQKIPAHLNNDSYYLLKRLNSWLLAFLGLVSFSNYIFLLYCPPTSYKACDILPNEQYLQASIRLSKIFSPAIAVFLKVSQNWGTICSYDAETFMQRFYLEFFFFFGRPVIRMGIMVGEPLL